MESLPYYGILTQQLPCVLCAVLVIFVLLFLGFFSSPLIVWAIVSVLLLFCLGAPLSLVAVIGAVFLLFLIKPLRTIFVSKVVLAIFKKFEFIPKISETERVALEAGVVWVEKDLFSGKPDFKKILAEPYPNLTAEEKAFMDGPVEKLCELIDPWKIWQKKEIGPDVWSYIKKEKFFWNDHS